MGGLEFENWIFLWVRCRLWEKMGLEFMKRVVEIERLCKDGCFWIWYEVWGCFFSFGRVCCSCFVLCFFVVGWGCRLVFCCGVYFDCVDECCVRLYYRFGFIDVVYVVILYYFIWRCMCVGIFWVSFLVSVCN